MKTMISIEQYLQSQASMIEQALRTMLPTEWPIPERLREAMVYSLEAGGKRIRPTLLLTAANAVQNSEQAVHNALPAACAIEYIHTYSLIHDDLPAMDDDDFRRGKPTNHKVFGEAMAILAGDALLTHAFHLITRVQTNSTLTATDLLAIVEDLSRLSGPSGMVGGQVADMEGEQGITSIAELEFIHLHKTSDLIVFAVTAGGRIGGASKEQLEQLRIYGQNIGLAFQIQDDILDLIGDEQKMGKKANSDVEQSKVTYPYLYGLEESKLKVAELTAEAKNAIVNANFAAPERLLQIADYLVHRDH
ncbi:polyprenyl synthetase family protein [Paenibacillus yanchengensis]|uniref:Polyprenyl synthetase family protein n=1 Tax=Paenibacillus yanchengensis TaxID=2035833 RepID=A0ABW4YKM9_9BACL